MSTKSKERITQVKIEAPCYCSPGCTTYDICWIRSDLAKVGKKVQLQDNGSFGLIFTVTEVYSSKEIGDLDGQVHAWREFSKKLGG